MDFQERYLKEILTLNVKFSFKKTSSSFIFKSYVFFFDISYTKSMDRALSRWNAKVQSLIQTLFISGVFSECDSVEEQTEWEHRNVHLLYEQGIFTSFVELLSMETE